MTRFWAEGLQIAVMMDEQAQPTAFMWQHVRHEVLYIYRRWRVDQSWWRGWTWREYFVLRTQSNLLVMLYRDIRHGTWYLQRVYD